MNATLTVTFKDRTKKIETFKNTALGDMMVVYSSYLVQPDVVAVLLEHDDQVIAAIDKNAELPYDDHTVVFNILG